MSRMGWRYWSLKGELVRREHRPGAPRVQTPGTLTSVNGIPWYPGEPYEAECEFGMYCNRTHPNGEPAPGSECHCGIWFFDDPEIAIGLPHNGYHRTADVFGCCEVWGDIEEHELGGRAQFAVVRAIVLRNRHLLHPAWYDSIDICATEEQMLARWDVAPIEPLGQPDV